MIIKFTGAQLHRCATNIREVKEEEEEEEKVLLEVFFLHVIR
jgi:hypothetical protein